MNDRVVVLTFLAVIMLVVGGVVATVLHDDEQSPGRDRADSSGDSRAMDEREFAAQGGADAAPATSGARTDDDADDAEDLRPNAATAERAVSGTARNGESRSTGASSPRVTEATSGRRRITHVLPEISNRTFRLATSERLEKAVTAGEWTIDGDYVVAQADSREMDTSLTLPTYYAEIERIIIRGGLGAESPHNFRVQAGPVSLIFNWEVRDENHYRVGTRRSIDPPRALEPGLEHEIVIEQREEHIHLFVDDVERWKAKGTLHGPVTVYPALGSKIFVRDIAVRGRAVAEVDVTGPAYPLQ